MTMRSLFSRVLTVMFASHLLVMMVLAVIFVFAVQRSIENWNVHRGRRLQNLMAPAVSRVYRLNGKLSESEIHEALRPFLTSNAYVYVTNASGTPVYLFEAGDQVSVHQRDLVDTRKSELEDSFTSPVAVLDGGTVVGYLYADTLGFRTDLANQNLLRSLFTILLGGTGASLLIALGVAYSFSRVLSRQATQLATGISELAGGRRDVNFPLQGAAELRTIAQSARTLQAHLSREERLRTRWTQDIAHDLRTPITALKTQFEGMLEGYITPSTERLASVQEEVQRIDRLVRDLRELSRMESPDMTLECEWLDADSFMSDLQNTFTSRARDTAVEFRVLRDDVRFRADGHLLHRALSNVLENAFRYVSDGGRVVFSLRHDSDVLVWEVRNTGAVDPAEIPMMFERFYRGEASRGSSGSGLGLSIAQAVVQLHGGSIDMTQEMDETVVTLRLPQSEIREGGDT